MMTGEIEYDNLKYPQQLKIVNETHIEENRQLNHFPLLAHPLVLTFVIMVNIVMMSLLVALAIRDIEALSKRAQRRELEDQILLINHVEISFSSKLFRGCPDFLKSFLERWAWTGSLFSIRMIFLIFFSDNSDPSLFGVDKYVSNCHISKEIMVSRWVLSGTGSFDMNPEINFLDRQDDSIHSNLFKASLKNFCQNENERLKRMESSIDMRRELMNVKKELENLGAMIQTLRAKKQN